KWGEPVSGDGWRVEHWRDEATVLVADGLGHGLSAHEASRAAIETLAADARAEPHALMMKCHEQLARTRGAAVAICRLLAGAERGVFASVGNVVGRVENLAGSRQLVSYNGIVGHSIRKVQ